MQSSHQFAGVRRQARRLPRACRAKPPIPKGHPMQRIAEFLFEAMLLKRVQRTGYQFLGPGNESVAEHTFGVMCIAWTLARMVPAADEHRLLSMCLVHDLPEARMGDINSVQKRYVTADEKKAIADMTDGIAFGSDIAALIDEFNACRTMEARLAHDADQLAFLLDLKALADMGYDGPAKWAAHVRDRLETQEGKALAESIAKTEWDAWWFKIFVDRNSAPK
jgi:putative hydrolases of HD superfamily